MVCNNSIVDGIRFRLYLATPYYGILGLKKQLEGGRAEPRIGKNRFPQKRARLTGPLSRCGGTKTVISTIYRTKLRTLFCISAAPQGLVSSCWDRLRE